RFGGRIAEPPVDTVPYLYPELGIRDRDIERMHCALAGCARLIEVRKTDEDDVSAPADVAVREGAHDIERPVARAVSLSDLHLQGNVIADLPAVLFPHRVPYEHCRA